VGTDTVGQFFLVGCPRSGTTLLQSLLAAHPRITSFPETHFFSDAIGQYDRRLFGEPPASLKRRLQDCAAAWMMRLDILPPWARRRVRTLLCEVERQDLWRGFPGPWAGVRPSVEAFLRILDQLARDAGTSNWVAKTPNHIMYVDTIERFVPGARFIHNVRNGADNIASLFDAARKYPRRHWGVRFGSVDRCITAWTSCLRRTLNCLGRPSHLVVRYERLVADPPGVLQGVADFMGVTFDEAMLAGYREAAGKVATAGETWKGPVAGPIRSANATKFYQLFHAKERAYIEGRLAEMGLDDLDSRLDWPCGGRLQNG
jgi:hypothetical protein